ncbi:MAG TPA: hypothetical protein PLF30_03190 [Candidatus Moranbacteria bacterium]|jgi:hypothetical protein|nr:hypothetical protein [Candidatus Moranbacteria bacterium]HQB59950.1 hypothetical protein [Candidatus Moranbacteria bacterium]
MISSENKEAVQLMSELHDVIRQIQLKRGIRSDFESSITKKKGCVTLKIKFSIVPDKMVHIECDISQLREHHLPCYKGHLEQVCPIVAATA